MRSSAAVLFCLLVVQPLTRAEFESYSAEFEPERAVFEPDNVPTLTDENFDEEIKNHKYILVIFCDPKRSSYSSFAWRLFDTARLTAEWERPLSFGKVDYTKQTKIKERFQIKSLTAKFFVFGEPVEHYSGRHAVDTLYRLDRKCRPPGTTELTKPEELTAFKEANKVAVVGFFKNRESDAAKTFLRVLFTNDVPFGISSDDAVYAAAGAEDGQVVLYKKFDEGRNVVEKVGTFENLKTFVAVYSLPLVVDYAEELLSEICLKVKSIEMTIMLFIDKQNADYEKVSANFLECAKQFRGTVIFGTAQSDHPEYARLIGDLGPKESGKPRIRMIPHCNTTRFRPDNETDLEPAAISAFVHSVLNGEIEPYFSQNLPQDWDEGPVKVLVGTNIDDFVSDKSKNLLVGYYNSQHTYGKRFCSMLEQLGEFFRDNDQVVIAKIDVAANELDRTESGFEPGRTLKLHKKNTNKVARFFGIPLFENVKAFVETNIDYGDAPAEDASRKNSTAR